MSYKNRSLYPVFGPLLNLLRSRKFIVAVMTVLLDLLVAYVPALEPVRVELLAVLTVIGSALVAAIAYEDAQSGAAHDVD